MSGIPRDLAAPELWQASMQRSLARREGRCIPASDDRGDPLGDQTTSAPRNRLMPRERPATVRDLADGETWDLSLGRSRARRRAAKLRFMPARTRAKRISLGSIAPPAAAPAASLGDTNGVSSASAETGTPTPTTTKHEILLSRGSEGRQVKLLQKALHVKVDGIFGPETEGAVVMFQKRQGLEADGIVGPRTKAALSRVTAKSGFATTAFAVEATDAVVSSKTKPASDADTVDATISSATTSVASKENPVKVLQETLHVGVGGIFGPETLAAVKRFQAKHHLAVDGIVGPKMWEALGYRGMKEVS